jgi:archaellum biogenesis ATPase FlaH
MLDEKTLMTKCVLLLYKEGQASRYGESKELVTQAIQSTLPKNEGGTYIPTRDIISSLRELATALLNPTYLEGVSKSDLLDNIAITCADDPGLYTAFEKSFEAKYTPAELLKSIGSLTRDIKVYMRDNAIMDLMSKTTNRLRYSRGSIFDVNDFMNGFRVSLDSLIDSGSTKDPAMIGSMDFNTGEGITDAIELAKEQLSGVAILKTGNCALNDMTQGGIRIPSFTSILGLQHRYKTGLVQDIFRGVAENNIPVQRHEGRQPALVYIATEDSLADIAMHFFKSMKNMDTGIAVKPLDYTSEEIGKYVSARLTATGFHVKVIRINPVMWNYRDLNRFVNEMISEGLDPQLIVIDYLSRISLEGIEAKAGTGTDLRELWLRARMMGATYGYATITPHQMAPDANLLIRGGVGHGELVKEISDKNYYAGSKQLSQEPDLELFIHTFEHKLRGCEEGSHFLTLGRGKHRGNVAFLSSAKRYAIIPFPANGSPIPDDAKLGVDYTKEIGNYYRSVKDIPSPDGEVASFF